MKNLIKIDCDNFFISERLKFIEVVMLYIIT